MGQYLVTRAEGAPPNTTAVDALSGTVFFQLWQVRADPYRVLANGDTLWWVDQRTREVRWEMRVRNLRRRQCSSVEVAHEYLRRWFGLFPGDLSTYKADGVFRNGWLIAWQNEIVAPCDTVLLGDVRVRQSGFLPVDDVLAARLGLPTAGRPALRPLPDLGDADLLAEPQERAIPLAVRRAVFERDGSRCRSCGTESPPFHLDHVYPWSKGGPNTVDNLQVLCAPCNLKKAARVSGRLRPQVPSLESIRELALTVDLPSPTTGPQLERLLVAAIPVVSEDELIRVVLQVVFDRSVSVEVLNAVRDALLRSGRQSLSAWALILDAIVLGIDQVDLTALAEHPAQQGFAACAVLCYEEPDGEGAERLARRGVRSSHPPIAAMAHYTLALKVKSLNRSVDHLQRAFELGEGSVADRSALALGTVLADRSDAVQFLLYATRSADLRLVAAATHELADRFADDDETCTYYRECAEQIEAQIREQQGT